MRQSTRFQNEIVEKLRKHFVNQKVEKEWSVAKHSTDVFSNRADIYAPQLDVAVGPFNIETGNNLRYIKNRFDSEAPQILKDLTETLQQNPNPRCAIAIEVAFSGSSKHFLGDITNASMMGLYGFVVGSSSTIDRLKRIVNYTKVIKGVGKASGDLFSNVYVISDKEFLKLLRLD